MKYEINGWKREDLQRQITHAAAIENPRVAKKKPHTRKTQTKTTLAEYEIVFGIYR